MDYSKWIEFGLIVFIGSFVAGKVLFRLFKLSRGKNAKKFESVPWNLAVAITIMSCAGVYLGYINIDKHTYVSNAIDHYGIDVMATLDLRPTKEYMKQYNLSMDQVIEVKSGSEVFRYMNEAGMEKVEDLKLKNKLIFANHYNIVDEKLYIDTWVEKSDEPFSFRAEDVIKTQYKGVVVADKANIHDRPDTERKILGELSAWK